LILENLNPQINLYLSLFHFQISSASITLLLQEDIKSKDTEKTKGKRTHETNDEEEDEDGVPAEDGAFENSERKGKEIESEEASEDDKDNDDSVKGRKEMKSPKRGGSADTKKSKVSAGPKKISSPTTAKSPTKSSSSKHPNAEDKNNGGTRVFSRKQKGVETPKKKSVSSETDPKEKASGMPSNPYYFCSYILTKQLSFFANSFVSHTIFKLRWLSL